VRYIYRNPLEAGLVDNLQKYQWSTHKIYLSDSKRWKWLHKEYILKLFSKSKPESIRLYKQFVHKKTPEEINRIFGRKNLPAVLGSKSFVDRIKDKFFNAKYFEEIPETKRLAPDIDKIKYAVCKSYNIKETKGSLKNNFKFLALRFRLGLVDFKDQKAPQMNRLRIPQGRQ